MNRDGYKYSVNVIPLENYRRMRALVPSQNRTVEFKLHMKS